MTDLFNNYYDNPRKQVIYANMTCPGASSSNDISFRINDGNAEIINSKNSLAELNLDNITSDVNNWNLINKTIKGNSVFYLSGDAYGESYKQYGYGYINKEYNITDFNMCLDYVNEKNIPIHLDININGNYRIEDIANILNDEYFTKNDILIEASIEYTNNDFSKGNIIFKSLKLAQDFYIYNVSYSIEYYGECLYDIILESNDEYYIPNYKYRNGAFKGLVLNVEYPKYNNNISAANKSIMITNIKDRVAIFHKDRNNNLYHKYYVDVFGNLILKDEAMKCQLINNDNDMTDIWINDEQEFIEFNGFKLLKRDAIGLYGYCNYASINNLWINVGQLYSIVSADDIANEVNKNLNNGIIIYNPNDYDINVNILSWI